MQRSYDERILDFVRGHPHFEGMRTGIAAGDILPCLRKHEIDFYEGGARLFGFDTQNVFTDRQYVDRQGTGERSLTKDEQTQEVLEKVRETARTHRARNVTSELAAVHALFPAFAVTRDSYRKGQLALADVEVRFGGDDARDLPGGMIDLVFLMPDRRALFLEAKCMGNPDISSTGKAAVEEQITNYEKHIRHPALLDAINRSLEAQSKLVGREIESAIGVFSRVPILLLDPSSPQMKVGPRNSWLTDRLEEADGWAVGSERPLVIDGRRDPAAAVRAFVAKFESARLT